MRTKNIQKKSRHYTSSRYDKIFKKIEFPTTLYEVGGTAEDNGRLSKMDL